MKKISLCAPSESSTRAYGILGIRMRVNESTENNMNSELVADAILENQIVDVWPDYPCLYDARSTEFKKKDLRERD